MKKGLASNEMYLVSILINNVILKVHYGPEEGEYIHKNIGTHQDDCHLATLLIVYLEKFIKPLHMMTDNEDYNKVMCSDLDWLVNGDLNGIEIDPKYTDAINLIYS